MMERIFKSFMFHIWYIIVIFLSFSKTGVVVLERVDGVWRINLTIWLKIAKEEEALTTVIKPFRRLRVNSGHKYYLLPKFNVWQGVGFLPYFIVSGRMGFYSGRYDNVDDYVVGNIIISVMVLLEWFVMQSSILGFVLSIY